MSAFAPKRAPTLSAPVATPRYGQVVEGPAQVQSFDHAAYECVQTEEALDRWIARATEVGVVGFDTETDALSATHAGLCGVSLAIGPNEACYIPLTHEHEPQAGEGGLFGDAAEPREPIHQLDKPTTPGQAEDPAGRPVGPEGVAERQIRHRRHGAPGHPRRAL